MSNLTNSTDLNLTDTNLTNYMELTRGSYCHCCVYKCGGSGTNKKVLKGCYIIIGLLLLFL